jgi:hypothetical protein
MKSEAQRCRKLAVPMLTDRLFRVAVLLRAKRKLAAIRSLAVPF